MTEFISGLDLNEQFYQEVVRPILRAEFPDLVHSVARLGGGSDVLGFDDAMSTDHDWGIRQQIFLQDDDEAWAATAVSETLAHNLPYSYRGISVHFGEPDEEGSQLTETIDSGPVNHRIQVTTMADFFTEEIGIDPHKAWDVVDWLSVAQQQLLHVTAGRVFVDGLGQLIPLRQKFSCFPRDVWLYLLSCQWSRIGQEDHFVGRTGIRGDDIGSRLLAGRLVHDIMMLGFLYEKRYAPYPKWFGTAFARLDCGPALQPILHQVLTAVTWQEREAALCQAFALVGDIHNSLDLTSPQKTGCEQFYGRPFQVHTGDYVSALRAAITDKEVLALPPHLGSIDQFSDNTDLRSYPAMFERLRPLYKGI